MKDFRARSGMLSAGIGVALVLGAGAVFLWTPWHGPIILWLSSAHGIDTGDLPALALLALAVAIAHPRAQAARAGPRWPAGRWAGPASAVMLGALLLFAGFVDKSGGGPLVPAGGGTFDGARQHVAARQADPVSHWSHLALTYDGATLRLYVNGTQLSSRATTGTIPIATDPLWIGGNDPYGEYFQGLIDEVRLYDQALSPSEVRAEMSTPIRSARTSPAAGLVGAFAFNRGSGIVAADASGKGNAGEIIGATWTTRGRFGGALRFDGTGEVVRVPASPSLNLRRGMTLSAWIRPTESQDGWRTILQRQTDVYFLMAGSDRDNRLGAVDDVRVALLVGAMVWFCVVLASGGARWVGGQGGSWWPPVALFLAGSVVDAAFAPSGTLIGPTLVAIWYALNASHRGEAASMYIIATAFTAVTVVSLAHLGGLDLARADGGIARSAALGLLLLTAGLLGARYSSLYGEQRKPDTARTRW